MLVTKSKDQSVKLVRKLDVVGTDQLIEKYTHNFQFEDTKGNIITKDDILVSVLETEHKGLKFRYYRKSKTKVFFLSYWFKGKSLRLPIGTFKKGSFGMTEVEAFLKPIVEKCKTGRVWHTDPNVLIAEKNAKEEKKQKLIEQRKIKKEKDKTVNQTIEMACEENFPKTKVDGTVSATSLRVYCLYNLGYNERTKHLIFTEDDEGNGLIKFTYHNGFEPKTWKELFERYPSGVGIIDYDPTFNPNKERSVYDSDLGKRKIKKLIPGDIEEYINRKKRSYGYKDNLLDTLSHLWSFARNHQSKPLGNNPPLNPCRRRDGGITIKKSRKSKFKGSKYNKLTFTTKQLIAIEKKLWELVPRFDFRALALLFIMFCAKRQEETLKIRWSDIDYKNKEIKIRLTKTRKAEYVDFDEDILKIINKCKELRKELLPKTISIHSLKWIFISPRIDHARLHDDTYVRGDQTRLKRLDTCMRVLKEDLGIPGSMKTFRKAFDSGAIHKANMSAEELSVVTGQSPQTIHKSYNHPDKIIRIQNKKKIRKLVFNKP